MSKVIYSEEQVVTRIETLTVSRLRSCVAQGWVKPAMEAERYRFSEVDVARLQLVCTLCDEMRVDEEAVPLVLNLLDQVHGLRRELKALAEAVQSQPPEVQRAIAEALKTQS